MIDMRGLYTKVVEKIGDVEINADSIVQILKCSMECIEGTQLKGEEKRMRQLSWFV